MSDVAFILLSAFFLAVPVVIKYTIAFQTRSMLSQLRNQERSVHALSLQLEGMQSEKMAVRRALTQVHAQRRQADASSAAGRATPTRAFTRRIRRDEPPPTSSEKVGCINARNA